MIACQTVLVVAAHPDDEVLGCGGTLARLSDEGVAIHVAFLADGVGSRYGTSQRPEEETRSAERQSRREAARRAGEILGVRSVWFGDYPDNRMDTIPLLDIVQTIETVIESHKPDTIFTHHAGDVNVDHRRIHEAITAACRPQPAHCVRTILCFEVASSTEWQLPGTGPSFMPNMAIELAEKDIDRKLRALECYADELRLWPHRRSLQAISLDFQRRGSEIGVKAAEAFMLVRSRCLLG